MLLVPQLKTTLAIKFTESHNVHKPVGFLSSTYLISIVNTR